MTDMTKMATQYDFGLNKLAKPVEQTSAGICGMHGCYVGRSCPKCVTQPKTPA